MNCENELLRITTTLYSLGAAKLLSSSIEKGREIDDNDGDDSVANVPLKFQGLEHDDSISKWKLHPALLTKISFTRISSAVGCVKCVKSLKVHDFQSNSHCLEQVH